MGFFDGLAKLGSSAVEGISNFGDWAGISDGKFGTQGTYDAGGMFSAGIGQMGDSLFGTTPSNNTSWGNFKGLEAGGNAATSGVGAAGLLSSIGGYVNPALKYLGDNKDAIGLVGGLAGKYFENEAAKDAQDTIEGQIAYNREQDERAKRQLSLANRAFTGGF